MPINADLITSERAREERLERGIVEGKTVLVNLNRRSTTISISCTVGKASEWSCPERDQNWNDLLVQTISKSKGQINGGRVTLIGNELSALFLFFFFFFLRRSRGNSLRELEIIFMPDFYQPVVPRRFHFFFFFFFFETLMERSRGG